jgi:hypothetical protein
MKHLDDPYAPPARQGYQAPAPMPMMGGGLGGKPEPPQYAQFEVGKNGLAVDPKATALSEDALPPMPSWETAAKKHVLTEEEEKNAVELGELDPATGQKVPLMESQGRLLAQHTQISLETITARIRTRTMPMGMEEDTAEFRGLRIHMLKIRTLSVEMGEDMLELLDLDLDEEEGGLAEATVPAQLKTLMVKVEDMVPPRHKTAMVNQLVSTMLQLVHTIVVNLSVNSPMMADLSLLNLHDSTLLIPLVL